MTLWAIFHEGKQITAPLPEYKAIEKYKELSSCLLNLDLRILHSANKKGEYTGLKVV